MSIIALDTEYTLKCPIGTNKGNPMWKLNRVVLGGYLVDEEGVEVNEFTHLEIPAFVNNTLKFANMVVGCNIKADLLYLYREYPCTPLPNIWDIQLAEYLLTGQQHKYPSLNELIEKYIGKERLKDSRLKEYWDAGIDTDAIPVSILRPYLHNDVQCTMLVFKQQWEIVSSMNALPFYISQMEALRATTSMALQGMSVDTAYIRKQLDEYGKEIETIVNEWEAYLGTEYSISSPKDLSLVFFGGERKIVETELVGKYKNGNDKYKKVEKVVNIPQRVPPIDAKNGRGYYNIDENILKELSKIGHSDVGNLADLVSRYRKNVKIRETYYQNLNDLVFPGNKVYPNISHTNTGTGRLACSAPNVQNQTLEGGVKKSFIPSNPENVLVEFDYSQLEIVFLAYLTRDSQLMYDINHKIDIHTALYKDMYGLTPTKDERKAFKPRTFLLIYGGSANALATQANISKPEATRFIDTFYRRYPGVKEWHMGLLADAYKNRTIFYKESDPKPFYKYMKTMPWGRRYHHVSYDNEWTSKRTFSPTELKNYPVQGTATGDMMPMMLGVLQRYLEEKCYYQLNSVKMIMTVHDSILLEFNNFDIKKRIEEIKQVLESAPYYWKQYFNSDMKLPLTVGASVGANWQAMVEV